jgi:hypothetical protein
MTATPSRAFDQSRNRNTVHRLREAFRYLVTHALLASLLLAMGPARAWASGDTQSPPPQVGPDVKVTIGVGTADGGTVPSLPPTAYVQVQVDSDTAAAIITGQFTDQQLVDIINNRLGSATSIQYSVLSAEAASCAQAGGAFQPPSGPNGEPLPPPVKLPDSAPGVPRRWVPVQGTPGGRPIKWKPETPILSPDGGQPGGSWDDEHGHWDIDNGRGGRVRCLPTGEEVGSDPAHSPLSRPLNPTPPFTGLDFSRGIHLDCFGNCFPPPTGININPILPAIDPTIVIIVVVIVVVVIVAPEFGIPLALSCSIIPGPGM